MKGEGRPVAVLELLLLIERQMPARRADPPHARADDRHGLALDHRLGGGGRGFARLGELRAPRAAGARCPEGAVRLVKQRRYRPPLARLRAEQRVQLRLLGAQAVALGPERHLLEPAQAAQPHVEDRLGLRLVEARAPAPVLGHERGLGVVLGADDRDHPVEVEEGHDEALEHLEPLGDLAQPVARAPQEHLAPVVEEGAQDLAQRGDLGRAPVDQHVHVEGKAHLEVREAEELRHQHLGLDRARAGFEHDAHLGRALVAHIGEDRQLLGGDDLGEFLDQPRLRDLIGDLGDDDLPGAAAEILDLPARAYPDRAAPAAIGFGQHLGRLDDDAPRREIGPRHQRGQRRLIHRGIGDERAARRDQLADVVGRDVRRHPDGDPARAIGEKIGEGRRQHDRFLERAVVIGAEIDRVLVEPLEQRLGGGRQPRLGVAARGRVVAVDVAEIALPVDQRVAHVEILREAGHRVIDRRIAMRVIVSHHVARDLGRFAERPARGEPEFAHGKEDPPVHGLQPVARVGQRAMHDRRERILQIARADRARERLGGDLRGFVEGIGHGLGLLCPILPVQHELEHAPHRPLAKALDFVQPLP